MEEGILSKVAAQAKKDLSTFCLLKVFIMEIIHLHIRRVNSIKNTHLPFTQLQHLSTFH